MSISEIPEGQIGPIFSMYLVEVSRCPEGCPAWLAPRKEYAEHGDACDEPPVTVLYTDDLEKADRFAVEETHRYRRMYAGLYYIHGWTGQAIVRLRSYDEGKLVDAEA